MFIIFCGTCSTVTSRLMWKYFPHWKNVFTNLPCWTTETPCCSMPEKVIKIICVKTLTEEKNLHFGTGIGLQHSKADGKIWQRGLAIFFPQGTVFHCPLSVLVQPWVCDVPDFQLEYVTLTLQVFHDHSDDWNIKSNHWSYMLNYNSKEKELPYLCRWHQSTNPWI